MLHLACANRELPRICLVLCVVWGAAQAVAPRPVFAADALTAAPTASPYQVSNGPVRGLIVPLRRATLSSRLQASILAIGPESGESFAAGDVLVRFDCETYEAEAARADAQVEAARADAAVKRQLSHSGSASRLQAVLADAQVKRAEAEAVIARRQVDACTVRAPYAGRVIKRIANAFETVGFRDPLMEIVGDEALEIRVFVPSSWIAALAPGQPFQFDVDETGERLDARVVALGAVIDNVSGLIELRGRPVARARPLAGGMSGTARFGDIP